MSQKTRVNLVIICILLMSFPLLWIYNQRLNYRKVLTLNTKFNLNANNEPTSELSSVQYVLDVLEKNGLDVKLDVDVKSYREFGVTGRILETTFGDIEVYEYSSKNDASKMLKTIRNNEDSYLYNFDIYQYKNLLILNTGNSEEISATIGNTK